jgi:hypothetical protein
MMKIVRRIFLGIYLTTVVMCTATVIWLDTCYFKDLPRTPDPQTQRVHRVVVSHGSVRYGTEEQIRRFALAQSFMPPAAFLFCVAVGLGLVWGDFRIGKTPKWLDPNGRFAR